MFVGVSSMMAWTTLIRGLQVCGRLISYDLHYTNSESLKLIIVENQQNCNLYAPHYLRVLKMSEKIGF